MDAWRTVSTATELIAAVQAGTPAIEGRHSDAIHVRGDGPDLTGLAIGATDGERVVRMPT